MTPAFVRPLVRAAHATGLVLAFAVLPVQAQVREPSAAEKALDAAAFQPVQQALAERLTDIQSVVVVQKGRVAYEFYRDGDRDKLRDLQSVTKSALSMLAGVALTRGDLASIEVPVLTVMPEWAALNSDPRAAAITVRHLLTLTAGFDVGSATSTSGGTRRPQDAWARPLVAAPGEKFAYDNALVPMLGAVLEKATGMPLPDYARKHLVGPMGLAEPSYQALLHMRTMDIAKLGQLVLNQGVWDGKQVISADYIAAATRAQNAGGAPVGMPYGYMWWILPTQQQPAPTFMASGYGGQMIWVHRPLDLVVAVTSTISPASASRGHSVRLLREGLFTAAEQRAREP
jgi:CubicO group peptidase (beta-lactamase class C family)